MIVKNCTGNHSLLLKTIFESLCYFRDPCKNHRQWINRCNRIELLIMFYKLVLCRFKAVAAKSKQDLVSQGFTEFTIEDFHNTVGQSVVYKQKLSTIIVYERSD